MEDLLNHAQGTDRIFKIMKKHYTLDLKKEASLHKEVCDLRTENNILKEIRNLNHMYVKMFLRSS